MDKLADAIRGLGATTKSAEYPSFAHEKVLRELERPDVIDDALVRLVERATPSKLVALTRRMRERVRLHG